MKVSLSWLQELVKYNLSDKELADKLSLNSIGIKDQAPDYLELDLTYNRGDLLSIRGVAREVAAIAGSKVNFEDQILSKYNLPQTLVKVEDSKLCPVYVVAKIENLKVEYSSDTWVKKLSDSGIRAVNNIADVTNLIMLEYGQPMHAFDAQKVKGNLRVRVSKNNEKIITLDGKARELFGDLLITDDDGPIGIAGIMGGKNSEVSITTSSILLETAIFNPVAIRNTSKRHGLYSEASKRFQHGLTKTNLLQALSAAIKMYEGMGGKLTAITMVGDLEDKPRTIELTEAKLNSLMGVNIPAEQVETSLKSLGFHLKGGSTNSWQVTVPFWRLDIQIEEDLIEEVARMYGYERIPPKKLVGEKPIQIDQSIFNQIYNLKKTLANLGLTEAQTYSFYSSAVLEALGFDSDNKKKLVRIANPISKETEFLRMDLWPNLVEVVGKNIRKGFKDIAIFEVGKVYSTKKGDLPNENYRLSIALMNNTENPLEELISLFQGSSLHPGGGKLNPASLFHPTRITNNIAEVHLRLLNKLGIEKRVAVMELVL